MRQKLKTALSITKATGEKATHLARKVNDALPTGRANEIRMSAAGTVVGAIGGATLIGGMGLALLGTAIPVAGAVAVGAVGLAAGNKIGSEIDRRKSGKRSTSSQRDE